MSVDILKTLAQQDGIDTLPKMDPNTQNVPEQITGQVNLLSQAAIPAVLAGFYCYSRKEQDAETILSRDESSDWITILFGDQKKELLNKVAEYAGVNYSQAESKMQSVAKDSIAIITSNVSSQDGHAIKGLMTEQRNPILQHLPASLGIGNILNDTTLDDRTNKMEGPVSSFMHAIEKTFSGSEEK